MAKRPSATRGKKYSQVGRVLEVLDCLADGPQSTPELADALQISERTTYRFMVAMLEAHWPVLYHRAQTSERLQWGLDLERLLKRLNGHKRHRRIER